MNHAQAITHLRSLAGIRYSTTYAEDLDRGFEALNDAHYLNDGDVVYFDDNTRRYYQVSPVEVASYGEMLRKDVNDAYSLWCAETSSEELPRGYNPETEEGI